MKKSLVLVLVGLFICISSVGFASPISFTGTITGDVTLNVPADFADINAALDYLSDKRIATNAIVTIQMSDGTYNYTNSVEVKHPDGDKIQIVGNPISPGNCVLNFSNLNAGILVQNGNKLGRIQGIRIFGNNSTQYGILVKGRAYLEVTNTIVQGCTANGLGAQTHSTVIASSMTTSNNLFGFYITGNSTAQLDLCTSNYNTFGISSNTCGCIYVTRSVVINNSSFGIVVWNGGLVYLQTDYPSTISGNGTDTSGNVVSGP